MPFRTPKRSAAGEPDAPATAQSAPISLYIGHLNHVSRRDALLRVQGLVRRQTITPEAAYYRLARIDGGYAYEIQEGGARKAYLPALLKRMRDAPDMAIHLRAGNRVVRVQGGAQAIVSVVLPEGEQPTVDAIRPTGRMRPFESTGMGALFTAAAFFAVGAVALACSVLVTTTAAEHWEKNARAAVSRRVEHLPIQHWPQEQPAGTYVSRVQYVGGHWTVQTKSWEAKAAPPKVDLPAVEVRPESDQNHHQE